MSAGTLLPDNFKSASDPFSADDDNDYFIYNGTTGQLWFDADRDGTGGVLLATLTGAPPITEADIVLLV